MANFQVKTDLPIATQKEIDRISAIASAQRTSVESAFLTSLSDYLYNKKDVVDEDGYIVIAQGHTLPTGLAGFAKSALFRKTNVATGSKALYENIGDVDSAVWDVLGSVQGTESQLTDDEAPVNAVNAFQTLTATTITQGIHAVSVLTSDTTNVAEDEVVVVGAITYRWRNTLAQAYDVKIGADAQASLVNLKKAINGTGVAGTDYFAGTVAHTLVIANEITATTLKIWSRTVGTANNTLATTTTASHLSWADTTLGGGTGDSDAGVAPNTVVVGSKTYSFVKELSETSGASAVANQVLYGGSVAVALDNLKLAINGGATAGTEYSTGTTAHTLVTATTNTNSTQVIEYVTAGVIGNGEVALSDTLTDGAWGDTTLAGGVDGTVGVQGQQYVGASYIYTAIADNTIADKNWRRVSLGSVY